MENKINELGYIKTYPIMKKSETVIRVPKDEGKCIITENSENELQKELLPAL